MTDIEKIEQKLLVLRNAADDALMDLEKMKKKSPSALRKAKIENIAANRLMLKKLRINH